MLALSVRAAVLWDDPFAHGYDGYYYVLQVRSVLAGDPLFADRSLVFLGLAGLSTLLGSVVVANKVAACLFGAITAVAGAVAAWRWTDSRAAALTTGLVWALSSLHLDLSSEFLKNAAGLAALAVVLALLPRSEDRRGGWILVLAAVLLSASLHKLTGVFSMALAGLYYAQIGWAWTEVSRKTLIGAAFAAVCASLVASLGVLRAVDFSRFLEGASRSGDRLAPFTDGRLGLGEQVGLLLVYAAPVVLGVLLLSRRFASYRRLGLPLLLIAVVCTAPGLPMGYELTAWRLQLMGFLVVGLTLGLLATQSRAVLPLVLVLALALLPDTLQRCQDREPDYVAWSAVLPVIERHVAPGERLVAHRGLCGFVWAETGRVCQNFEPSGDPENWWRITFGFGVHQLEPYGPATRLLPTYALVREPIYRRFRADHVQEYFLLTSPRNPYELRPDFVYGPGEEPPL